MPCVLPGGLMISPSGLALALANLSARQVKELDLQISGTYGPHGSTSSISATLQICLESKLRRLLIGSTLYKTTWKEKATPLGRLRFHPRALALPTSEGEFITALPTPVTRDFKGKMSNQLMLRRKSSTRGVPLPEFIHRELGRPGHVNPALPRTMMGFPPSWCDCAVMATQSIPTQPRRSLKPGKKHWVT